MTYEERQAINGTIAKQVYYNAIDARSQDSTAIAATPYRRNGLTGQTESAVGDGTARFTQITSSNQLGITSIAAKGNAGNAGFNDGRSS